VRMLPQDGIWMAKLSNKHCCGTLIVKKRGDGEEDMVYLEKDHVCAVENKRKTIVQSQVIVHEPDNQSLLMIINRCLPYCGLTDQKIKSLSQKLEDAKGWEPLTGNTSNDHWYFPTLSDNKQLYGEIHNAMALVVFCKFFLNKINNYLPLKPDSVGDPDIYPGAKLRQM
jgi:hypothetical protein